MNKKGSHEELNPEKKVKKRKIEEEDEDNIDFDIVINYGQDQGRRTPEDHQTYHEESTPSIESVYKNYRELKEQPTDKKKFYIGLGLLLG